MPDRPAAAVPVPLTPLIGRTAEITRVADFLGNGKVRLVTLTGPGGVGKTRLALQVATDVSSTFADGAAFVSLAPVRDPELVIPAIAATLGLQDMGGNPVAERLVAFLRHRKLLLVLDNVEQLLAAGPIFADLLGTCPDLTLLVTSRAKLRLSGEQVVPIAPLGLPAEVPASLETVQDAPAIRLFVLRAQASQPTFALTAENADTVRAICARLDGLPLAIELAAARIDHLPLPTLLARLDPGLPLLTGGARDLPGRLRTMRDAIAWSYDLLSDDERRLFRRLAVFRNGVSLEAIEALGVTDGRFDFDLVATLVETSLLQRDAREDEPRYRTLETVREFGLEQLAANGELDSAHQGHATYFLDLAERAAPEWWGSDPGIWLDRLATDYDNLRAAIEWSLVFEDPELGGRLVAALHWYWRIRGPVSEGRRWMEATLSGSSHVDPRLRSALLTRAGDLAMLQSDLTQAADLLTTSMALAQTIGDRAATTWAVGERGILALHQGRLDQAAVDLTQTLNRARVDGPPSWIPVALGQLASIARRRGDLDREATLLEEALATSEAAGMTWCSAGLRCQLGDAAVDREAFAHAEAHYREALGPFRSMHERRNMAGVLAGFAWIAAARRDAARAAYLCGAVDALLALTGVNLSPHGQIRFERARAASNAALPPAAFASAVAAGQRLSLEQVIWEMEGHSTGRPVRSPAHLRATDELTEREASVLRLLITRQTDKEIAAALFLGPRTVQSHVASILAKLGVANRREAAEEAIRRGLV